MSGSISNRTGTSNFCDSTRGEIQLIDKLTPDLYERLLADAPGTAVDAGPTLDSEFLWFNQAQRAPIAEHTKTWFRSTAFRRAISLAIQRADLCRVVYRGHATPAAGPVAPSNKLWFNPVLSAEAFDPAAAAKLLAGDGFRLQNGVLRDRGGNAVEFSIVTNSGSKTRERMAAMIQADLGKLGIKINIVTLDFPSLIERMTRTLNYEACLLGLVNVDPDPSELMNVLLSSASNHPWNPSQKTPETAWEAEIDKLMLAQAATADYRSRKKNFDRVQEIMREQQPVIYLLHPNSLSAVSKQVTGVKPTTFFPHTFWDAEHLTVGSRPSRAVSASEAASRLRAIRFKARAERGCTRCRRRRDSRAGGTQRRGQEHHRSFDSRTAGAEGRALRRERFCFRAAIC